MLNMHCNFASQLISFFHIPFCYLIFSVVSYLAMFHLEDLGLEQFSTIIKSLDSSKMSKVRRSTVNLLSEDKVCTSSEISLYSSWAEMVIV